MTTGLTVVATVASAVLTTAPTQPSSLPFEGRATPATATVTVATTSATAGESADSVVPHDLAGVESLYAADLVARINAERAARAVGGVAMPQLSVDPGLSAAAQAWADHLAAIGTVADPSLGPCTGPGGGAPQSTTVCTFAANSGSSGNGFWPGDGSDGMNQDYMNSTPHRENMLNAAYTDVGVGVGCAGGQAYTVELFGYTWGDIPSAEARQGQQSRVAGNPVASTPQVAGAPSGVPVYCPGQTSGPDGSVTASGGQFAYPYSVTPVAGEPNASLAWPVVGIAATADDRGYWVARGDGTVSDHGDAADHGSMAGTTLAAPISHIVATPDGGGYWLVAADGGIFSFGDARFYGSMGGRTLDAPVVGMTPTPDGRGYWLVAADGGIFSFGDARFLGSMGGHALNRPVVGIESTPDGRGYWLVATDGGVFSFGDARFYGSTGSLALNKPVHGMAVPGPGTGYWFVASDGGIFSFGDAPFRGSAGAMHLGAPVVGMAADTATGGYWLVDGNGGVYAFGAPFYGAG